MELNLRPDGCLPSCTLYRHDSLCPVIHSAEQIEIAYLTSGYVRLKELVPKLQDRFFDSPAWDDALAIINQSADGTIHAKAVKAKNECLEQIAEGRKSEKAKMNLTCNSCGVKSSVDLSLAIRSDQFIRCNSCEEKVHHKVVQ